MTAIGTTPPKIPPEPTQQPVKPPLERQLTRLDKAKKVAKTSRDVTEVVVLTYDSTKTPITEMALFSADVLRTLNNVRFVAIIPGLIAVPGFFKALGTVAVAPTMRKKMLAVVKVAENSSSMLNAAVQIAKGLADVGRVTAESVAWTSVAAPILLPFDVIAAGKTVYDAVKFHAFRADFMAATELGLEQVCPDTKRQPETRKVEQALTHIQSHPKIQKRVQLSRDIRLQEVSAQLVECIKTAPTSQSRDKAIQQGTKLISTLRERVNKKWYISVFAVAAKVIGIAAGILMLATPMGLPIIVLSAIAVGIGIGVFAYSYYVQRKTAKVISAIQKEVLSPPVIEMTEIRSSRLKKQLS